LIELMHRFHRDIERDGDCPGPVVRQALLMQRHTVWRFRLPHVVPGEHCALRPVAGDPTVTQGEQINNPSAGLVAKSRRPCYICDAMPTRASRARF
jgi:hypothetical protein